MQLKSPTHEKFLLPHWKEFCDALQEHQFALKCFPKEKDTGLAISGVELPPAVIEMLSNSLKSTHFKTIAFTNNRLHRYQDGIGFVSSCLRKNPLLEAFFFSGEQNDHIQGKEHAKKLCQSIETHPTIHTLQLNHCCRNGVDGYELLCSIITAAASKIKYLDFSCNSVSTRGDTFLADFLATNPI